MKSARGKTPEIKAGRPRCHLVTPLTLLVPPRMSDDGMLTAREAFISWEGSLAAEHPRFLLARVTHRPNSHYHSRLYEDNQV